MPPSTCSRRLHPTSPRAQEKLHNDYTGGAHMHHLLSAVVSCALQVFPWAAGLGTSLGQQTRGQSCNTLQSAVDASICLQ